MDSILSDLRSYYLKVQSFAYDCSVFKQTNETLFLTEPAHVFDLRGCLFLAKCMQLCDAFGGDYFPTKKIIGFAMTDEQSKRRISLYEKTGILFVSDDRINLDWFLEIGKKNTNRLYISNLKKRLNSESIRF